MGAQMTVLVRPEHLNHHGFLFGGRLLEWLDEQGYIAAISLCWPQANLVTVGIDRVEFKVSVAQGEIIHFKSCVVHVGRTSITAYTLVNRHPQGEEIFSAYTTFVARGADGRPTEMAPLLQRPFQTVGEAAQERFDYVEQMRARLRQEKRGKG